MFFSLEHYSKFLTTDFILSAAKKTGFMIRNKGVSPTIFLDILLNPNLNVASDSLGRICLELSKYDIFITKQSIFEKLTKNCTDFLEIILESLILQTQKNKKVISFNNLSENISSIQIADSSGIALDSIHSDIFPGISAKLKSRIKLLLSLDPRTLSISTIQLSEGKKSDQNLNEHLFNFRENTLILKDLGFTSIKDQEKIELQKGKYISRVKLNTDFYLPTTPKYMKNGKTIKESRFKKIDIPEFYKNLEEGKVINTTYYFKNGSNFYSRRVIISKVPAEKLAIREEATTSKVRDSEHEISEKTRAMIPFTIYVTNLKIDEVSSENIHGIYARRWDIEIIFKKLKSVYNIDKVKVKVNIERILIQIYSKLILFALECLYAQDIHSIIPNIELSSLRIGNFIKFNFEKVLRTKEKISIPIKFLVKQVKKDIKKSRKKL